MKKLLKSTGLLCAFLAGIAVHAQLALELTVPRPLYLEYERIIVRVRMRNYSGQPLVFGRDERLSGKLLFDITLNGKTVEALPGAEYPMTGTILQPGETREFLVQLNQYYKLTRPGIYNVHAYVRHRLLPNDYKSQDRRFEITPGSKVWSRTVGIPELLSSAMTGERDRISERTYELRMILNNADRLYYLVVEDPKHIYAVLPVGRMVGVETFRAEIDMLSRLHLLVPVAPKLFRYYVVGLDGRIENSGMYKTDRTAPSLYRQPETGKVGVVGGAEAQAGIDYDDPATRADRP